MNKRSCPVCDSMCAEIIMKFTPQLLTTLNPTYDLDVMVDALKGKEEFLTYSKCKKCSMVFCENVWDNETLRLIYDNAIDHDKSRQKIFSIEKRISLNRFWINVLRILKLSGQKELRDLKVVDFGCGWGDFLNVASGYGVDVIGFDGDSKKASLPKQTGYRVAESIEELKACGPVDVFVMISVFEHLQDVNFIMNLIGELLKKDGLLMFTVMDYRSGYIKKNVRRLLNQRPALTKNLNPIEHVNVFDFKSVMAILKKYGFDFISTGIVLYLTDMILLRDFTGPIKLLNQIERMASKVITRRELGITVYAKKN